MRKLICIITAVVFLFLAGCSKGDEKTAEKYVKSQGYTISAALGELEKYTLKKSAMLQMKFEQEWGVQTVEPDKYFGKEITIYRFIVKNHPLEKNYKDIDGVVVSIMLSKGKVIGGLSSPNPKLGGGQFGGGPHSLDGRTMEDITGLSYKEFLENWKKKYGES